MGINGINNAIDYNPYEVRKAANRTQTGDFSSTVNETSKGSKMDSLHGQSDVGDGEEVKFTWMDVQNNKSYAVCTPSDYDPANPVYKIKEWDASGRVTERMIDVSKVDPKNCDVAEMYAYSINQREKGASFEDTVLKAAVAKAVNNANMRQKQEFSADGFMTEKTNWVDVVKGIMDSEQSVGNWKGYLDWKKFLSYLEK